MDIRVTLGRATESRTNQTSKTLTAGVREGSLSHVFEALSKQHPELAPILEDAAHASDVEIFVNNTRIVTAEAEALKLREGDQVRLMVKNP